MIESHILTEQTQPGSRTLKRPPFDSCGTSEPCMRFAPKCPCRSLNLLPNPIRYSLLGNNTLQVTSKAGPFCPRGEACEATAGEEQGQPRLQQQAAQLRVFSQHTHVTSGLRGTSGSRLQPSPSSYSWGRDGPCQVTHESCLVHPSSPVPAFQGDIAGMGQAGSLRGEMIQHV